MYYDYSDNVKIEDTLSSLAESRETICLKLEQMQKLITEIQQEYKKHSQHTLNISKAISDYNSEVDQETLRQEIDRRFWGITLDLSQVEKFISSKEKSDMRDKINENPPVYSQTQARNLIQSVMNSTDALATNLIKKIYADLTNVEFHAGNHYLAPKQLKNKNKIEKSFRMSMFSRYGLPSYVRHNDAHVAIIQDLERVCYLVDGKLQPESMGNIVTKIEKALRSSELHIDGEYFTLTMFKNGNVKVDFKDMELVKKINLWGARNNQLPDFSGMFK